MPYTIPFNKPPVVGTEMQYLQLVFHDDKFSGDGPFNKRCQTWLQRRLQSNRVLTTPSCTAALEMCALLLDIQPGDEIIMPSYTFVSTANAFVLRGAKIIFVDIRQDTLNIDETLIEGAITDKTRAIVVVHYAGVACEMDAIMAVAEKHDLYVVEDAAQALMADYKGKALGSIGHLGTFSFHETKNYSCGEGGALAINDSRFVERAEILQEKGTNRSAFIDGRIDKYSWVDIGSSFLLSELQAAFLMAQLDAAEKITQDRLKTWNYYFSGFESLAQQGKLELPDIPKQCNHNAHIFHLRLKDSEQRRKFMRHCSEKGVGTVFHYVPLHSSEGGKRFGMFYGKDEVTTTESDRIVRLPLYYSMTESELERVVDAVISFYK